MVAEAVAELAPQVVGDMGGNGPEQAQHDAQTLMQNSPVRLRVAQFVEDTGFTVTVASEEVYAGQSMLVSAFKPS